MKKVLTIIVCLVLSGLVVFGLPRVLKASDKFESNFVNEKSLLKQSVLGYSKEENTYYKLYNNGVFVGAVTDLKCLDDAILIESASYSDLFPGAKLSLKTSVYTTAEQTYDIFENIDDQIIEYLTANNLIGIKANAVQFSTSKGIYDIIYVSDLNLFYSARDEFLTNFISEETLQMLRNNEEVADINSYGTIETGIKIQEKITYSEDIVAYDEIFTTTDQIYQYLCYGDNQERQTYTIQDGDTLSGIGYFYGNLSPKQLLSINRDVLTSTTQILVPGTKINVTYFTSPITVEVTKQRLAQESITPENPHYIEDESLSPGLTVAVTNEVIGLKNVLYEETWVNGVLRGGDVISSVISREPIQGVIRIGVGATYRRGTGTFVWPVDNPILTCAWGNACYIGHNGTDIASRYQRYGNIYAADSGTVEKVGYDDISGFFIYINHNNGFRTYYGHMNKSAFVNVGQAVERGQLIGQIGMTGVATGPHVHFMIFKDDVNTDACSIMNCNEIR